MRAALCWLLTVPLMGQVIELKGTDLLRESRAVINSNFSVLNLTRAKVGACPDGQFTIATNTSVGVVCRALVLTDLPWHTHSASDITTGTIAPSRLPFPGAADKGGILAATCPTGQYASGYDSSGQPVCSAPSSSGSVTSVELILPADFSVSGSPITSNGALQGAWATPPTGSGPMVRSTGPTIDNPTITGAMSIGDGTSSGEMTLYEVHTPTSEKNYRKISVPSSLSGDWTLIFSDYIPSSETVPVIQPPSSGTSEISFVDMSGTGSFVRSQSPTIVSPTIASFANAVHTHQNSSGGGALDGASIGSGTVAAARLGAMTGADGTNAGAKGAVPAPAATDNTKYLRGDGTWANPSGGSGSAPMVLYMYGGGTALGSSSTVYGPAPFVGSTNGTEVVRQWLMTRTATITSLSTLIYNSAATTCDATVTLRVNGADTSNTLTIPAASTTGYRTISTTSWSQSLAAGDKVSLKIFNGACSGPIPYAFTIDGSY